MKTIERSKQRDPRHRDPEKRHVSYRLPRTAHDPGQAPAVPAIPEIRRLDADEIRRPDTMTSTRRPYVRWLGLLTLVLVVGAGIALVPSWLDDGTTTTETPWTPDTRGLTTEAITTETPWTPELRGLTSPEVVIQAAPWTAETRGLVVVAETPWTPDTRGLTTEAITTETPWTPDTRGLTTEAITTETPWTPDTRGLTGEN